jgi:hypothetical protein
MPQAGGTLLLPPSLLLAVLLLVQLASAGLAAAAGPRDTSSAASLLGAAAALAPAHTAHDHHHGRRQLLQSSSYAETACSADDGALDAAAVQSFATTLLGDSRLAVTAVRFMGACQALARASMAPPHAFAGLFPAALVLSTGDAAAAAGDVQDAWQPLSTDLQWPGDANIGARTRDAAILELELAVSPGVSGDKQLVLQYLFGSEEYGTQTPNPDVLSISIAATATAGSEAAADVAVLPAGGRIAPPTAGGQQDAGVQVYSNSAAKHRTALNGFTQVCRLSLQAWQGGLLLILFLVVQGVTPPPSPGAATCRSSPARASRCSREEATHCALLWRTPTTAWSTLCCCCRPAACGSQRPPVWCMADPTLW